MNKENLIVVMSAGIRPTNTGWESTPLNDSNESNGAPGGDLRIIATSMLFLANRYPVFVPAGIGRDVKHPNRPPTATVIASELQAICVPRSMIAIDTTPTTTAEQLHSLAGFVGHETRQIIIVSSRYHLGRIQAMMKQFHIAMHRRSTYVSAEEYLLKHTPGHWERYIEDAYNGQRLRNIIIAENHGLEALENGTYAFA